MKTMTMNLNFELDLRLVTYYPGGTILDGGTETSDPVSLSQDIKHFEQVWKPGESWIVFAVTGHDQGEEWTRLDGALNYG